MTLFTAPWASAQTRAVLPDELSLRVTVEQLPDPLFRQEMVLLTIHGIYRRHITREELEQPDFAGFNWMQLGQDHWFESVVDGRPVKNMRRRMAVFPDDTGRLEIGAFQHHLTLLDEDNKWFEHTISSEPISIEVMSEPASDDWWFPVRRLRISDEWSNAPDQLEPGQGVLRVMRISALGASPDMIPPMPDLVSPSALIFPHPEKRLVDLTPLGPEAIAFWRWTVTPTNGHSAILEPITFSYFDAVAREMREVSISPQRVAYGAANVEAHPTMGLPPQSGQLGHLRLWGAFGLAFALGLMAMRGGRLSFETFRTGVGLWWIKLKFRYAVWRSDLPAIRAAARRLDQRYEPSVDRQALLDELDEHIFGRHKNDSAPVKFAFRYQKTLGSAPSHENVH
ncbi:BatD family protein [Loktanella sp. S4079]|uniref:BatD family protein n=1 Tax=Loktanella sp. S4079 TaxID=579483 RepID=UPI0006970E4E|nr:BatD family protein [Loktanella sp. S4079]